MYEAIIYILYHYVYYHKQNTTVLFNNIVLKYDFEATVQYLGTHLYRIYSLAFPSTWQECWDPKQDGQFAHCFPCKTSSSCMAKHHSLNAR